MGLDITWYRGLTRDDSAEAREAANEGEAGYVRLYANSDFPGREAPLPPDGVYRYEKSGSFRAGSYGGYNNWRDQLAQLAGYPAIVDAGYRSDPSHAAGAWQAQSGPFWELLNFADNEGLIGSEAAARLAADFAKFQPDTGDTYFLAKYAEWRRAFENAADRGAVDFH